MAMATFNGERVDSITTVRRLKYASKEGSWKGTKVPCYVPADVWPHTTSVTDLAAHLGVRPLAPSEIAINDRPITCVIENGIVHHPCVVAGG